MTGRLAAVGMTALALAILQGCGNGTDDTLATGGSPLAPAVDSDGDGISDSDELALGLDPDSADTDGDGWDDGVEIDGNTDPLKKNDHPYTGGWAIGACRNDIDGDGNSVGDTVEQFKLDDQFGETVKLHDFCDREVLLVGAAGW